MWDPSTGLSSGREHIRSQRVPGYHSLSCRKSRWSLLQPRASPRRPYNSPGLPAKPARPQDLVSRWQRTAPRGLFAQAVCSELTRLVKQALTIPVTSCSSERCRWTNFLTPTVTFLLNKKNPKTMVCYLLYMNIHCYLSLFFISASLHLTLLLWGLACLS